MKGPKKRYEYKTKSTSSIFGAPQTMTYVLFISLFARRCNKSLLFDILSIPYEFVLTLIPQNLINVKWTSL